MLFKKLPLILFVFLSFSNVNAQKFELGKVSVEELQEKEFPKDSSAAAAVLFEKGEVHFEFTQDKGFIMVLTVKEKIKIYKKEGYEWANKKVLYRISNGVNESVTFSDAVTYNLVDGKIEKTKLKSDGVFDEKINKYYGNKKIAMPNVKVGSIIEHEYTLRSPIIGSLRDWNFQSSIPVNHSEYKTYVPEYYTFNQSTKGFLNPKVSVQKIHRSVKYTYRETNENGAIMANSTSQEKLEYLETQTTYLLENVVAMKDETFVNNIDNYTASISNELVMTKYPYSNIKYYSTDWESVTKTIYDYDDFGAELNKTGYFEDDVNALLKGLTTNEEKIAVIFNYVKSAVKFNNLFSYSCDEGVKKAFKDKTGNAAEINLMLTAILRFAGFTANPVLVSTRDNGIALFPSRTAFNYVIAAIETAEGQILLDATEKYSLPNILPLRDLNWQGRLIRKDKTSIEVDLMPKNLSRETLNMNVNLKNDGTAEGKLRRQLSDHKALEFRLKNSNTTKDIYLEELENKNNSIEINDYIRENELDLNEPIVESFSFKDSNDIEIINDKIYISPMLFFVTKENPFKQEVREYPVDFSYPLQNKFNINIRIPEGYVVESMPSEINIATGENIGAFKYIIVNTGRLIQVMITLDRNVAIVSADYYDILKAFYQQMIDKQNEKIVLKKI